MIKFLILFIILLSSCTKNNEINNLNYEFNLKNNITFNEFKQKLDEYANNSSYPNIDN
jgi:hypothetical protein